MKFTFVLAALAALSTAFPIFEKLDVRAAEEEAAVIFA